MNRSVLCRSARPLLHPPVPKRLSVLPLALPPRAPGTDAIPWLVGAVRDAVLAGQLVPGTRLPSTRDLARSHGVARSTVVEAYERLQAEGYAEGRPGAGTFVRANLGDAPPRAPAHVSSDASTHPKRTLSAYAARVPLLGDLYPRRAEPFRTNRADPDLFPRDLWRRLAARRLRADARLLDDVPPLGFRPLREAIAEYVRSARGGLCDADQVAITAGTRGALDLLGRLLLDPGDRVGMEDPGYRGAMAAFGSLGADLVPVPVDGQGCTVPVAADLKALFVTPGHQFPTGVTMGLPRRLALLEWARLSGSLLIEDDYDSDFWYAGRPLPALQGLDRHGSVALVGSFSKTLASTLRLGFVVLPPDLVEPFTRAASVVARHGSGLDQAVLADLLADGHYARHLRRTREIYAARLAVLQHEVERQLGGALRMDRVEAGLQTIGWLPPEIDAESVTAHAASHGVVVVPVSRYATRPLAQDGLQLGFGAVSDGRIRWGVERLAQAVAMARASGPTVS